MQNYIPGMKYFVCHNAAELRTGFSVPDGIFTGTLLNGGNKFNFKGP